MRVKEPVPFLLDRTGDLRRRSLERHEYRSNYFDRMLRDMEPMVVPDWRNVAGRCIKLERH